MLIRKLAIGVALTVAVTATGCKCCGYNQCNSPPIIRAPIPAPCNSCGTPGAPGVVVPPPGAVGPAPVGGPYPPPPGAYGASFERKT